MNYKYEGEQLREMVLNMVERAWMNEIVEVAKLLGNEYQDDNLLAQALKVQNFSLNIED